MAALVAGLALATAACGRGDFVEVTIVDPTAYPARVEVRGEDSGWVPLTRVEAGSERTVSEVIDQGTTWVFAFVHLGHREEVTVTRAELARDEWKVTVPASFEESLREAGVEPPPS